MRALSVMETPYNLFAKAKVVGTGKYGLNVPSAVGEAVV